METLTGATASMSTKSSVKAKPLVTKRLVTGKEDNTDTSKKPSDATDGVVAFIKPKEKDALVKPHSTSSASGKRQLPVVAGARKKRVIQGDKKGGSSFAIEEWWLRMETNT